MATVMDRNPETSWDQPSQSSHSPKKEVLPVRMIRAIAEFGNQVAVIKIKWLVAGMLVFLFSVILTQVQFNDVNDAERAKLETQRQIDIYLASLTDYNTQLHARNLCLDGVVRADNNREQWQDLADQIALSGAPNAAILADEIRNGPLFSQPPRTIDDCPSLPPVPVAPAALASPTQGDG